MLTFQFLRWCWVVETSCLRHIFPSENQTQKNKTLFTHTFHSESPPPPSRSVNRLSQTFKMQSVDTSKRRARLPLVLHYFPASRTPPVNDVVTRAERSGGRGDTGGVGGKSGELMTSLFPSKGAPPPPGTLLGSEFTAGDRGRGVRWSRQMTGDKEACCQRRHSRDGVSTKH